MDTFDKLVDQLLNEFNVEDRNDPAFYDYAVIFVQQLKQRNLIQPGVDVRKTSMQIVKDQYYNFIDEDGNLAYKIEFIFDSEQKIPNNLSVIIKELPSGNTVKEITNTHEESSINDIAEFIAAEQQKQQQAGQTAPEQVGETPSEMPNAVKPQEPNTSQYLKGL
jgi:hypothetical protein